MGIVDREALIRRLGEGADDPLTAATVVGAIAVVFSALYYGALLLGNLDAITAGEYVRAAEISLLLSLTVWNAVAVTWAVWTVLDLDGVWGYRYGTGAGLLVGLASHLCLGVVFGLWFWLRGLIGLETTFIAGGPGEVVGTMLLVAVFSVVYTAGVPILASVGVGAGLTYCRKRVAD